MSTTLTNGRQRKSLAEQIDRLDSVLDGLADGLNEAVATAVKETVHAVLSEVLSNPELLVSAAPGPARAGPPEPLVGPDLESRPVVVPLDGRQGPCRLSPACPGVR